MALRLPGVLQDSGTKTSNVRMGLRSLYSCGRIVIAKRLTAKCRCSHKIHSRLGPAEPSKTEVGSRTRSHTVRAGPSIALLDKRLKKRSRCNMRSVPHLVRNDPNVHVLEQVPLCDVTGIGE